MSTLRRIASPIVRSALEPEQALVIQPRVAERSNRKYGRVWFNMVKVTFTLDDETVARIRRLAKQLVRPQSQVVRESIKEYEAHADKLSEQEARRRLAALDEFMTKFPPRPRREVEAELKEIRASRRMGWRNRPSKRA